MHQSLAALTAVAVALALALTFLLVNLKAGPTWLKFVTMVGLVGSLALAVLVAVRAIILPVLS